MENNIFSSKGSLCVPDNSKMSRHSSNCHFCETCNGEGCIGELPGMGGFSENVNFILNCAAWKKVPCSDTILKTMPLASVRLGPMTGAMENIGYESEADFYSDIIEATSEAGILLSIGDGYPDIKLQSGIAAVRKRQEAQKSTRAAVFIKPYDNKRIFERIEWTAGIAESIGVDIDSYNIATMRNLVSLEKKNAKQLLEIKKHINLPFSIKGIFNVEEIPLIAEVKPDIVIISNHGGRVENRIGSTAEFLIAYGKEIQKYCGQLWVDGGIRTFRDIQIASSYGVKEVLIGRPFATALCCNGKQGVTDFAKSIMHSS